jgi:hypothetical protein
VTTTRELFFVDLAIDLARDLSPALYLRDRRQEYDGGDSRLDCDGALTAALETGLALESAYGEGARRAWARALAAAEDAGRAARRTGVSPWRLLSRVARLRDGVELVLFDGRLPPELAARAARLVAKMSGRWIDRALRAYWEAALDDGAGPGPLGSGRGRR